MSRKIVFVMVKKANHDGRGQRPSSFSQSLEQSLSTDARTELPSQENVTEPIEAADNESSEGNPPPKKVGRNHKRCLVCQQIPRDPKVRCLSWPNDPDRSAQFCAAMNVPSAEVPKFRRATTAFICSNHFAEWQLKRGRLVLRRANHQIPSLNPRPMPEINEGIPPPPKKVQKRYRRCLVCQQNPQDPKVTCFTWPNDPDRSSKFCAAMNVPPAEVPKFGRNSVFICSKHFAERQINRKRMVRLKDNQIPSLNPRPMPEIDGSNDTLHPVVSVNHDGDHEAHQGGDHDTDHGEDHDADHGGDHKANHHGDHEADHGGEDQQPSSSSQNLQQPLPGDARRELSGQKNVSERIKATEIKFLKIHAILRPVALVDHDSYHRADHDGRDQQPSSSSQNLEQSLPTDARRELSRQQNANELFEAAENEPLAINIVNPNDISSEVDQQTVEDATSTEAQKKLDQIDQSIQNDIERTLRFAAHRFNRSTRKSLKETTPGESSSQKRAIDQESFSSLGSEESGISEKKRRTLKNFEVEEPDLLESITNGESQSSVVETSKLLELFQRCQECGEHIVETTFKVIITVLQVKWRCRDGHSGVWDSQKRLTEKPGGLTRSTNGSREESMPNLIRQELLKSNDSHQSDAVSATELLNRNIDEEGRFTEESSMIKREVEEMEDVKPEFLLKNVKTELEHF